MSRDVALITGGNSGIGLECARVLARSGWHVLLASRNRTLSQDAVRAIAAECGAGAASELGLDLGSLTDVRRFAHEVRARDLPLRALILNAGLQVTGSAPRLSSDGFEITFAVNHLGHFLLANLLLESLAAHSPARVVVVSSGVHDPERLTGMPKAAVSDFATLAATGGPRAGEFSGPLAYVNSKLCNLWFAYELARRIEAAPQLGGDGKLAVIAYEPGLVPGSGLAREYPTALRFVWERILPGIAWVLAPVVPGISTAQRSGEALAQMVLAPALGGTSQKYFPSHTRWREAPSSLASYDLAHARGLWEASARMAALAPGDSPLAS